jgi:hypothetical protein
MIEWSGDEKEDAVSDVWNMRLVGHTDLAGHGDAMHINLKDGYAYVGHMSSAGTSIVDVRDPTSPRVVRRIPAPDNTHAHKVQILGDVLLVNHEQIPRAPAPWSAGLAVYDVADPENPRQMAFWKCGGKGVHRMTYWKPPYALVTAGDDNVTEQFLSILDLSDPSRPVEAGRWWYPGQRMGEERVWSDDWRVKLHHATLRQDRAYCGYWDQGVVILDISDVTHPRLVSQLRLDHATSRATHTAAPVPNQPLLITTEERIQAGCDGVQPNARVVDISDELNPKVVATFPVPEGDYCSKGGRFGPHNVHEPKDGYYIDAATVFLTYFNAGLRVFDISEPTAPVEIAYFVPDSPPGQSSIQLNDVIVDTHGLIYVTDRIAGGMYILELARSADAARPARR